MTDYTVRTTVARPNEETVRAVRTRLGEAGFGVLTDDIEATLRKKLDADVTPHILGARRPQLGHRGIEAEAFDLDATMPFAVDGEKRDTLHFVAVDARVRLNAALAALEGSN